MDNYYNNYDCRRKLISKKSDSADTRSALKNQHQDNIRLKLKKTQNTQLPPGYFLPNVFENAF